MNETALVMLSRAGEPMTLNDDASLLARYARSRDPAAFAILVERHAGLVYGTCLRQCGDPTLAEDASQECFLALAMHAAEIRQSLAAWLHTVALHAASRLGRARRDQTLYRPDAVALAPEVSAAWRELEPHLDQALAELPQEERSAIMLRYLEGHSQVHVAQAMGVSQATISRRIASGITQLRQRLAQHLDDEAMGAALGCATVPASPALVAHAAKIGLAGIGAPLTAAVPMAIGSGMILSGVATVAGALVLTLTLTLGVPHGHLRTPPAASRAMLAPVVADPPIPAASGMLALPITACVHGWALDRVVGLIDDQLPSQAGAGLELMPVGDYPLVDLRSAGLPLQVVLDQLLGAAGWRWRSAGTVVSIDRPLPPGALAGLLDRALGSAGPQREAAVTRVAESGDLDACAALLATLSRPGLDGLAQSDPRAAQAAQRSVLDALARIGGSWQEVVPRANPLSILATMPIAQQGLLASWQRCRRLGWPITFFQCYLAGELHVAALGPQLLDLVHDPEPFLPGAGSHGPARRAQVERLRQWGEQALGRMAYQPAFAALAARLATAHPAEQAALTGALAEFGDPAVLPHLASVTNGRLNWVWGVTIDAVTARLEQRLQPPSSQPLASLIDRGGSANWAKGDAFGCFPSLAALTIICKDPSNAHWEGENHGFWQGTGRLPPGVVRAVVAQQRRHAAPADAMIDDAVLARDGDDEALQRVVFAVEGGDPKGPPAPCWTFATDTPQSQREHITAAMRRRLTLECENGAVDPPIREGLQALCSYMGLPPPVLAPEVTSATASVDLREASIAEVLTAFAHAAHVRYQFGDGVMHVLASGEILGPDDPAPLTKEPDLDIASALAARLSPMRSAWLVKRVLAQTEGRPWTAPVLSLLSATHPPGLTVRLIADYPQAAVAVRSAILGYLADERTPAGRAFILAQAVIPGQSPLVAQALGTSHLHDPLLRAAINALPTDAGSVDRVSHGLEQYPDSVGRSSEILQHAGAQSISAALVARLCAFPGIRTEHSYLEKPWQELVLQWLTQSGDARVRATCCGWLGTHLTCDERSLRLRELTAVSAALAVEQDGAAAKAERQLLEDFLWKLADDQHDTSAFYDEDVLMGGGLDDLVSITTLDEQTIPALHDLLAPHVPTGRAPPSNF